MVIYQQSVVLLIGLKVGNQHPVDTYYPDLHTSNPPILVIAKSFYDLFGAYLN